MERRWQEITIKHKNYETILMVSDDGRVIIPQKWIKSRGNGRRWRDEREAKYSLSSNGYLRAGGEFIHRLVGELFVEKPKEWTPKFTVNHKDLDRLNNHWTNLEWVTQKDNIKHYLNSDKALGTKLHPVEVHTIDGEWVGVFPSKDEAALKCGLTSTMVGYVTSGRFKQSKGYVFKEITKKEYNGKNQKG